MYQIAIGKYAFKKIKKLLKKNLSLSKNFDGAVEQLKVNPFDPSLRTHKVNSKNFGQKYASSITGDLRFIWDFSEKTEEVKIIDILDVGGHSGKNGVY